MQEFLTNNIVNCNLMSLTGYRTLLILDLLMEAPKSTDEINDFFLKHPHVKEKFSNDTIRIYINSLRAIGCQITRANKSNGNKYELIFHPFDLEICNDQLSSLLKLYNSTYEKLNIEDLVKIKNLFAKILPMIKDEKTRESIINVSALKNVDVNILKEMIHHCRNKKQIIFLYKSPRSGEKSIEIIADKISFLSGKLYVWGPCSTYNEYSYFLLDRILKISALKLKREEKSYPKINVIYELYGETKNSYVPGVNEKILNNESNKLVIEEVSGNKFELIQKFLYMGEDCKMVYPESLKNEFIEQLEQMKESYN